jgi:hypothetical protein
MASAAADAIKGETADLNSLPISFLPDPPMVYVLADTQI